MSTRMDDYYDGEPDEQTAPDPWDLVDEDTYDTDQNAERMRSIRRTTNHIYFTEVARHKS